MPNLFVNVIRFNNNCLASCIVGIPAISIPIKLSRKGMPISLQIMGRNMSEPMILALAKYIENIVQFPHYNAEEFD